MTISILVADDDAIFRELLCDIINKEGYSPIEACNGQEAIDIFFSNQTIDLLILDVMMPIYDGWEVLREIRSRSEVPVMMLTALSDAHHEVYGLEKGADEYIGKPFSYEVFVARLKAMLRKHLKEQCELLKEGQIQIFQETRRVQVADVEVELNRKEYNLLVYLVRNKQQVLTRDQILEGVWGYDFEGDVRTVDTHIKTLRAKLLDCGSYIKTIRGTGYMFEVSL